MSKQKTNWICERCKYSAIRWNGACPSCKAWNTLKETSLKTPITQKLPIQLVRLSDAQAEEPKRLSTEIQEVDRVLGGGLVPGSLILLGGDPGIGKSTLLLQICSGVAKKTGRPVLYVSGEESIQQLSIRANRIGVKSKDVFCLSHCHISSILETVQTIHPCFLIIDSIQTTYEEKLPSTPGSPQQLREVCAQLLTLAKGSSIIVFLIGHVTKEGGLAGPRLIEHMVDAVLSFEGDKDLRFRFLRTTKNRFGSTDEVGVFMMEKSGLVEMNQPSLLFIGDQKGIPGSSVTCFLDGARPFLVEVQALLCKSYYANPIRRSSGLDPNRIAVLLAVAERRLNLRIHEFDVFFSVTGGIKLNDPSCDLSLLMSLFSSLENKSLPEKTLILGEVGLGGEIRAVPHLTQRVKEGILMGFRRFLIPEQNLQPIKQKDGIAIEILIMKDIGSAWKWAKLNSSYST
ncbi:DNA repair protein RadA [Candidatus Similichlamydia epinepheli]|uniref:DNA repair protein RadA n=1 Tax=Candidatus Similichlamydia epinepheli TaxID=1903953 RepID=UPI0013008CFF|nr:DNA repair protein RadA [Candidatus Similichlamydia epinepheli]